MSATSPRTPAQVEKGAEVPEPTFTGAPIAFICKAILEFVELAKTDPVLAVKAKPETVAIVIFTLIGMHGPLFGVVGAVQQPFTKVRFSLACVEGLLIYFIFYSRPRRLVPPLPTRSPPLRRIPPSALLAVAIPQILRRSLLQRPLRRRRRNPSEQMLSSALSFAKFGLTDPRR